MNTEVTVVVPFFNAGRYLGETLHSVMNQTYPYWRIIFVNDGSTDDSVRYIKPYLNDRRMSLVQHPVNLNLSKSLNTGLRAVETPYMIHLDGDDYFYPHTLEVLMNEVRQQPEDVALITGNMNLVFQNKMGQITKQRMKIGRAFADKYEFMKANTSVWPRFYRTDALRRVGGWPLDGPYEGEFCEDMNILFRLIEHYRFHWVDHPLLNHRRHDKNQTNHLSLLGESVEWAVNQALLRWGDAYEAEFKTDEEGWRLVSRLIPKKSPHEPSPRPMKKGIADTIKRMFRRDR
jgi:glycosyltransferase involved in cell wall biosynthesis